MKNTRQDIAVATAMLERARQVLELTYHDWRLHERPQRNRKRATKASLLARCHEQGFSVVGPQQGIFA